MSQEIESCITLRANGRFALISKEKGRPNLEFEVTKISPNKNYATVEQKPIGNGASVYYSLREGQGLREVNDQLHFRLGRSRPDPTEEQAAITLHVFHPSYTLRTVHW